MLLPKGGSVGIFIRDYLVINGPSSAYDIWKAWKQHKEKAGLHPPSYKTFHDYIYRAKRLGLIIEVGEEKGRGRFPRILLDVPRNKWDSHDWLSIQGAYKTKFLGGEKNE